MLRGRAPSEKSQAIPRVLYKYVPVENCNYWLKDRTVGFPALKLLNDPYEGVILSPPHAGAGTPDFWQDSAVVRYRVRSFSDVGVNPHYDPEARSRRLRMQERRNAELAAKRTEALRTIADARILSLTCAPDNMVMWAHYASNSQGLCIGIDWATADLLASRLAHSAGPLTPTALTVTYHDQPFQTRFERNENSAPYALGRKHTDWAYEREVRILRHANDFESYAPRSDTLVGLLPLPPEAVTDIVLGANPAASVRAVVLEHRARFPNARMRRLAISADGYHSRLQDVRDDAELQ